MFNLVHSDVYAGIACIRYRHAHTIYSCDIDIQCNMDKYLLIVLALLIGGMVIMATQERWLPFYGMLGGAVIVIMYSAYRNRVEYKRKRKRR